MKYEVNRKKLVKYMLNDDMDGLVMLVKQLCSDAFQDGYTEGYTEGYHDACDNQY